MSRTACLFSIAVSSGTPVQAEPSHGRALGDGQHGGAHRDREDEQGHRLGEIHPVVGELEHPPLPRQQVALESITAGHGRGRSE
jgi:hypothetical protein